MTKKEATARVNYWVRLMGMDNFLLDVSFDKNKTVHLNGMDQYEAASSRTNPAYKISMINIDPRTLLKEKSMIDEVIVHELLHCLHSQYDAYLIKEDRNADYFREQTVCELSRIVLRLHEKSK